MNVSSDELKRYEQLQVIALDYARYGNTLDLKAMLEAKMPVNLSDAKGNTLLMLASYNGNYDTTKMILSFKPEVDRKNDRGQTPLAGVCFKGYIDIVKLLVKAGANIYEDNGMKTTPLMFASIFGNYEIVDYLNSKSENRAINRFYLKLSKLFSLFKKR